MGGECGKLQGHPGPYQPFGTSVRFKDETLIDWYRWSIVLVISLLPLPLIFSRLKMCHTLRQTYPGRYGHAHPAFAPPGGVSALQKQTNLTMLPGAYAASLPHGPVYAEAWRHWNPTSHRFIVSSKEYPPPGGYDPSSWAFLLLPHHFGATWHWGLAYGAHSHPSAPPLVEGRALSWWWVASSHRWGWPVGATSSASSTPASRPVPTSSSSACRYGVECTASWHG